MKLTVAQVKELPDGTVVDAVGGIMQVEGQLVRDHRPDGTPYTWQRVTLEDATGKIPAMVYDQFDLKDYAGQEMIFASMKSRNHRFGGVSVKMIAPHSVNLFKPGPKGPTHGLRVSHAASIHTPETFAQLCETTARPE